MKKSSSHLSSVLFASVLALPALSNAAVILETSSMFTGDNSSRSTHTGTIVLNASTDTVLLGIVTGQDAASVSSSAFSAQYDPTGSNASMTELAFVADGDGGNNAFSAIYGISLGSVSAGSKNISWSINTGNAKGTLSLFQLAGATLDGFSQTTDTGAGTVATSFTGLGAGSFVISATGVDANSANYGTSDSGLTGTPTPTFVDSQDEGSYVNSILYTSDVMGSASHSATTTSSEKQSMASVAIAAIPEPSSLGLMGIALVGCLFRRSRP